MDEDAMATNVLPDEPFLDFADKDISQCEHNIDIDNIISNLRKSEQAHNQLLLKSENNQAVMQSLITKLETLHNDMANKTKEMPAVTLTNTGTGDLRWF